MRSADRKEGWSRGGREGRREREGGREGWRSRLAGCPREEPAPRTARRRSRPCPGHRRLPPPGTARFGPAAAAPLLPARSGPGLRADGALGRVVGAELPGTLQHRPCGWVPSGLWPAGYREGEGADLISAFQVFSVALSFLEKYL